MTDSQSHLQRLGFRPAPERVQKFPRNLLDSLSAPLPPDYEDFLVENGGGDFDSDVVVRCQDPPPHADRGFCLFGEFLDLGAGETSLKIVWGRSGDLLSHGLIPIASAAGGDLYCLRSPSATPEVAFWDHDSNRNYTVASSFTDFIARLELAASSSADLSKIKLTLDPDLL